MTFPMISYKYNNLPDGNKLATIMDQKLEPLGKFIQDGASATCEVEFEKVSPKQHGKVHRVEVNLRVDGVMHRTEAMDDSFELAIDEVRDELNKKLRRAKSKNETLFRKARQRVKEKFFNNN